ncbi:hypothetical protein GCM10028864_03860 [Microlunatus parietis]
MTSIEWEQRQHVKLIIDVEMIGQFVQQDHLGLLGQGRGDLGTLTSPQVVPAALARPAGLRMAMVR